MSQVTDLNIYAEQFEEIKQLITEDLLSGLEDAAREFKTRRWFIEILKVTGCLRVKDRERLIDIEMAGVPVGTVSAGYKRRRRSRA